MDRMFEYHAHLGASTPVDILWEISRELGIKIGTKSYDVFCESMHTPNKMAHKAYLNKFPTVQSIQSSPIAIEKSVYNAVIHAYKNLNIDLIELRFNPILRSAGIYDLDSIIFSATIGMKKAMLAYPIKAGLIIETDRTFTPEMSHILAQKAIDFKKEGVIGMDISGFTPAGFDLKSHSKAFEMAKCAGLGITIHASETGGAIETRDAIEYLYADRIGHGINIRNDHTIMKLVADKKIHLEICPTSNVTTNVVGDYGEMVTILNMFYENDISFNLNTDGSEFLNTTVENEFKKLVTSGMDKNILLESQIVSREMSFIK